MTVIARPVERSTRRTFFALPRTIYADAWPAWTPPLPGDEERQLNPGRNPALTSMAFAQWLAWDGPTPVGRIAAFAPPTSTDIGYFGFFESRNDRAVASALLRVAEDWLSAKGRHLVRGPIAVTPRDRIGLLTDGFDRPAAVSTPYNPPYYAALLEAAAYCPAARLCAYRWTPDLADRHGILRLADRVASRGTIRVRPLDMRRFADETWRISQVINRAFSATWGWVPIQAADAHFEASQLRRIVDPRLCLIAEDANGPCGVALTIPDANWLARRMGGRWWPTGWYTALRERQRIPEARVMALAIPSGPGAASTVAHLMGTTHRALIAGGYQSAELSQVFIANDAMRRVLDRMQCPVIKRYAVYERSLTPQDVV